MTIKLTEYDLMFIGWMLFRDLEDVRKIYPRTDEVSECIRERSELLDKLLKLQHCGDVEISPVNRENTEERK